MEIVFIVVIVLMCIVNAAANVSASDKRAELDQAMKAAHDARVSAAKAQAEVEKLQLKLEAAKAAQAARAEVERSKRKRRDHDKGLVDSIYALDPTAPPPLN